MNKRLSSRTKCLLAGLSIFFISSTYSCKLFVRDVEPDISYTGIIINATNYDLLVVQGADTSSYHNLDSFKLEKNSQKNFIYYGYYEEGDPVEEFFRFDGYRLPFEQTRVYRNDTLLANWIGPPRYMNKTEHDFYNINVWNQVIDEDQKNGAFEFTITNEDLNCE